MISEEQCIGNSGIKRKDGQATGNNGLSFKYFLEKSSSKKRVNIPGSFASPGEEKQPSLYLWLNNPKKFYI